jgi:membrane protein YdbS with pleckstrin-like domain
MTQQALTIRRTPFVFLRWLVIIEFFFALVPFLVALVANARRAYETSGAAGTVSFTLLVALVMTSLQVLIIAISFLAWYLPVYEIDSQRVVFRRANLFEDRELIRTDSIREVQLGQGWLGRKLGYGTLTLSGAGPGGPARVRDIPRPAPYARTIEDWAQGHPSLPGAGEPRPVGQLIAGGENQHVEFKSSLMWDYHQNKVNKGLYEPVMKNVVAFMNAAGGTVLIGVDDDGEVLGLAPDYAAIRKPDSDGFENVFNMAFNKMVGVEYRRFVKVSFPTLDGKEICLVSVQPATQPAYLVHQGTEKFYIRAGNASQPLSVSKAARYIQERFYG